MEKKSLPGKKITKNRRICCNFLPQHRVIQSKTHQIHDFFSPLAFDFLTTFSHINTFSHIKTTKSFCNHKNKNP